jgi:hypothetical protein
MDYIRTGIKQATANEYADFLKMHLKNGGKITHARAYSTKLKLMAVHSMEIDKNFPYKTIHIIVPKNIDVTCSDMNYTGSLLYMRDGSVNGTDVTIYPDVAKVMIDSGFKFETLHFIDPTTRHATDLMKGISEYSISIEEGFEKKDKKDADDRKAHEAAISNLTKPKNPSDSETPNNSNDSTYVSDTFGLTNGFWSLFASNNIDDDSSLKKTNKPLTATAKAMRKLGM